MLISYLMVSQDRPAQVVALAVECSRHRRALIKGKNASPGIDPWTSLFSSTTTWNGVFDLTAVAFDASGNASTPSAGSYDVENAYTTKAFTTHVCDPARTGCPKDVWDAAFSLSYPAIAKLKVRVVQFEFLE